jgi:simple sugar transport system permease protein
MFIVAPSTGAAITGDSMIGEYFRVFCSYGVITLALVMYEAKKRRSQSRGAAELARAAAMEEEAEKR